MPRPLRENGPFPSKRALLGAALAVALFSSQSCAALERAADSRTDPQPTEPMPERLPDDEFSSLVSNAASEYRKTGDFAAFEKFALSAAKVGDGRQDSQVREAVRSLMKEAEGGRKTDFLNLYASLVNEPAAAAPDAPQAAVQRIDHYVHEGLPENPSAVVVRLSAVSQETRLGGQGPVKYDGMEKKKVFGVTVRYPKLSAQQSRLETKETEVEFPQQAFVVRAGQTAALEVLGATGDARRPNRSRTVNVAFEDGIVTVAGVPFQLDDLRSGYGKIESWDGTTTLYVSVGGFPRAGTPVRPDFGK